MLEEFFKYPAVLRRMRLGPLADDIDEIAAELVRNGYARKSAIRYLSLIASFSRHAARLGCKEPQSIGNALGEGFIARISKAEGTRSVARTAVGHALRHVMRQHPPGAASTPTEDPDVRLLAGYGSHLRDTRGLQPRSIEGLLLHARRTLVWYDNRRRKRSLSELRGAEVIALVSHVTSAAGATATKSAAASGIRSFLRYLRWEGVIQEDLAHLVPRVPCWRLAEVPSRLAWAEVRSVIEAVDTSHPVGKRDRALLLLLATTGLRSGELRRLELRDVNWRTGELRLRRTKSCRERVLPLLDEAGLALADYVLHGRPSVGHAEIFLSHRPPVRPLGCSGTVAAIVRRCLARCRICPPRAGAHLLRHSLATRMVQQGRPIKEIADLLGHRSVDTTAVYIKVALPQLESVALPFPGGVP
jgi:integrase/recombinase XerD